MRASRSIPVLGSCLCVARGQLPRVSLELHTLRAPSVVSDEGSRILVGRHCLVSESVERHVYLCVYVDNIGIISFEMEFVEEVCQDLVHHFESTGLLMHGTTVETESAELLGVRPDLRAGRSRITDKRYTN